MAKTQAIVVNPLKEAGAQARASLKVLLQTVEKATISTSQSPKVAVPSPKAAKK